MLEEAGTSGELQGSVKAFLTSHTARVQVTAPCRCLTAGGRVRTAATCQWQCPVSAQALGPKAGYQGVVLQLQAALNVVWAKLAYVRLQLSASKTKAMLMHQDTQSRRRARCLHIDGKQLSWKTSVRTWGSHSHWKMAAQDGGCLQQMTLQLYNASALGLLMYASPLDTLPGLARLAVLEDAGGMDAPNYGGAPYPGPH